MKYKITESQFKKLVETARIQPYKGVVKGQEEVLISQCMIHLNQ